MEFMTDFLKIHPKVGSLLIGYLIGFANGAGLFKKLLNILLKKLSKEK